MSVTKQHLQTFWQTPITDLLETLETSPKGLTTEEANVRLECYGPNLLAAQKKVEGFTLFLRQFRSPIILIPKNHHFYFKKFILSKSET